MTIRFDIAVASRDLASLVRSGTPLDEALAGVAESLGRGRLARVFRVMSDDAEAGASLSEAMERHPSVFGRDVVEVVRMGEGVGRLSDALAEIAERSRVEEEMSRLACKMVVSPLAFFLCFGWALFLLGVFYVPFINAVFEEGMWDWPAPGWMWGMKSVFESLGFLGEHWRFFLGLLLAFGVPLFLWMLGTGPSRRTLRAVHARLPGAGAVYRALDNAAFTLAWSMAVSEGRGAVDAFSVAARGARGSIRRASLRVVSLAQSGEPLGFLLERERRFSPMLPVVLKGHAGGSGLAEALRSSAEFSRSLASAAIKRLGKTWERVLIIQVLISVFLVAVLFVMPLIMFVVIWMGVLF